MADQRDTGISWTDETWNPVVGCSIVSPACTNCYAMAAAHGIQAKNAGSREKAMREGTKVPPVTHYAGTTKTVNGTPVWTGKLASAPDHIVTAPLRWKRPRRVFVNSMSDLFHEDMPEEWIDRVFAVMALAPQHTFQILTKRPERMRRYIGDGVGPRGLKVDRQALRILARPANGKEGVVTWPLPNVWLGVTAEDQARADERIPHLLATPAAVRFVSAEPLLGPVNFSGHCDGWSFIHSLRGERYHDNPDGPSTSQSGPKLDWVIVGGESGPGARPTHPDWVRSVRDQCAAAGVAFHFKQWGEWAPCPLPSAGEWPSWTTTTGKFCRLHADGSRSGDGWPMQRAGKKAAGRTLDGRIHDAFPEAR
jgi:protein gp37